MWKTLEESPELSQRQLATRLGISLGKVNYCIREFEALRREIAALDADVKNMSKERFAEQLF